MDSIYLDWNASTPVHPAVREAMLAALDEFAANPSSIHAAGRRARQAVEAARESVAALVGAERREIVFTGGGSEANNLAITGALARRPGHVVTSAIEHPSVAGCLAHVAGEAAVSRVRPNSDGVLECAAVEAAFRPNTTLLTVMRANNETGVLQPVAELARRARARGVTVHTDAVQAVGKVPVSVKELDVDLLAISAHKIRGPKGVGALYVRDGIELSPLICGGGHERGLRAGTENVPGIVGMGAAADVLRRELPAQMRRVRALRDRLEAALKAAVSDAEVHGERAERLPNTCCIAFPGVNGLALLVALDRRGVAVSTGSACSQGGGGGHDTGVLAEMGVPQDLVASTLRISIGPATTEDEIERATAAIAGCVEELRAPRAARR